MVDFPDQTIQRAQLQNPLDAESKGILKNALEDIEKDIIRKRNRVQVTILTGATSFVVDSDYMVLTGSAAVTIGTIIGGREGQILTLSFSDANITIPDDATGNPDTINLNTNFVSIANSTLQLLFNGIYWTEIQRSTQSTAVSSGSVPTPPNDASKFLNGVGAYAVPAGGGAWQLITTGAFSKLVSTSLVDLFSITGISADADDTYLLIVRGSSATNTQGKLALDMNSQANWNYTHFLSRTDAAAASVAYLAGSAANNDSLEVFLVEAIIKAIRGPETDVIIQANTVYGNGNAQRIDSVIEMNSNYIANNDITSIQLQGQLSSSSSTWVGKYWLYKIKSS